MPSHDQQPGRDLDPVRDNVPPTAQPLLPGRVTDKRTGSDWREVLGPVDRRIVEAHNRTMGLDQVLYHLDLRRPLGGPAYTAARARNQTDRQNPDWDGPVIDDDYPELDNGSIIANSAWLVAALGGHLELRAVFGDNTAVLLTDPGSDSVDASQPLDQRRALARQQLTELRDALRHQYLKRPLIHPEHSVPLQYQDEHDPTRDQPPTNKHFPDFDPYDDLLIANIGRLVAAIGGYLELHAMFPDETVLLLQEPGPEYLHDGAS